VVNFKEALASFPSPHLSYIISFHVASQSLLSAQFQRPFPGKPAWSDEIIFLLLPEENLLEFHFVVQIFTSRVFFVGGLALCVAPFVA